MGSPRSECAETSAVSRRRTRVAVVGSGISGLGAAYLLSRDHDVVVFEATDRLGGHARTIVAGRDEQVAVDTGFIVLNDRNYPLLNGLFAALDVPIKKSNMSFGASFDDGACEYSTQSAGSMFADRRNLARPAFWKMLRDIMRFNRGALQAVADDPELSLGALMARMRMGTWFQERYLLPVSGAIWSTTSDDMMDFPAVAFTNFFKNHGLLTINDHPQWWTVDGGSRAYVERVAAMTSTRGGVFRTGAPVTRVLRTTTGVEITTPGAEAEAFDAVVIAAHSDQALTMLGDADEDEKSCLGAIRYKANVAYTHDDASVMPRHKACWSSWVYKGYTDRVAHPEQDITITYWMNRLQSLPETVPLFVTLNPPTPIPEQHIFDVHTFHHPQFDQPAIDAQKRLEGLNGRRNTWFCGAYARNGFHEDGLWSAVRVARGFGVEAVSCAEGANVAWA